MTDQPAAEPADEPVDESTIDQTDDDQIDGDVADDDEDDVEFDGKTFRAPKAVAALIATKADIEAQAASIAQTREAAQAEIAAQREAFEQRQATQRQFQTEAAHIHALDRELTRWREFQPVTVEDREERRDAIDAITEERRQAGLALASKWQDHERTVQAEAQQASDAAAVKFNADLAKLPGWTPAVGKEVFAFAQSKGFKADELAAVRDVRVVEMLRLAQVGAKHATKQAAAKTVETQQRTAPAPEVSGRRAPTGEPPDSAPAEVWAQWRNRQLQKKGSR